MPRRRSIRPRRARRRGSANGTIGIFVTCPLSDPGGLTEPVFVVATVGILTGLAGTPRMIGSRHGRPGSRPGRSGRPARNTLASRRLGSVREAMAAGNQAAGRRALAGLVGAWSERGLASHASGRRRVSRWPVRSCVVGVLRAVRQWSGNGLAQPTGRVRL